MKLTLFKQNHDICDNNISLEAQESQQHFDIYTLVVERLDCTYEKRGAAILDSPPRICSTFGPGRPGSTRHAIIPRTLSINN